MSHSAPSPHTDTPMYPAHPGIALNDALRRLGGRQNMLEKLLSSFLERHIDAADQMKRLSAHGDFEDACRLAHQIKGAAANLGANELSAMAGELEQELKNNQPPEAQTIEQFSVALNELNGYVNEHCQRQT